jgi:L-ascorbate metabolism protein UlaG (beta-lactamase superfamily)
MGISRFPIQQLLNQSSHSEGCKMKKQINIIVSLAIILSIPACGSNSELLGAGEPQPIQSQAIQVEEEQSQPTLPPTADAQLDTQNPYFQIETTLRSYPPCTGKKEMRKDAIMALDAYLKDDDSSLSLDMRTLYRNMIGFVKSEITEPVTSGVRIWSMYNHGFIVKTPSTVFAFDLINGYPSWQYQIPDAILEQIQVLFISHRHDDHNDPTIIRAITDFGGQVVMPVEDKHFSQDLVYLAADEEVTLAGLHIKAYDGLHGNIPVRMYAVTTPEGLTILHTGDNQTSETLPDDLTVDILLLNAWVNESGSASPVEGMRNSINKLTPRLTILGHIQELGHLYDPADIRSRLSFEAPLAVDDGSLPGYVSVQVWGEHCDFP